jgi:NADP-dependent 3-hydroxy acid dehydrogenase YdfG
VLGSGKIAHYLGNTYPEHLQITTSTNLEQERVEVPKDQLRLQPVLTMSKPVAIVTGAGSGIGEAVATHLYSKGYKVVVADLNPASGEKVASSLGSDATFIQTDVSTYRSQAQMFKRAYEWGGNRLDFFHANAGIDDRQSRFDTST